MEAEAEAETEAKAKSKANENANANVKARRGGDAAGLIGGTGERCRNERNTDAVSCSTGFYHDSGAGGDKSPSHFGALAPRSRTTAFVPHRKRRSDGAIGIMLSR